MKWVIVYWRYDKMVENLVLWCKSGEFKKTITQKTNVLIWLRFNLDILKSTCLSWLIGQINKCHNLISFDQFFNKKTFFLMCAWRHIDVHEIQWGDCILCKMLYSPFKYHEYQCGTWAWYVVVPCNPIVVLKENTYPCYVTKPKNQNWCFVVRNKI